MPLPEKLTLGERANMRDALRSARHIFGDNRSPQFGSALSKAPVSLDTHTSSRDRAILDIIRILDRLLE